MIHQTRPSTRPTSGGVPEDLGADTPDLQLRKPDGPLLAPSEVSVKDQPRSISASQVEVPLVGHGVTGGGVSGGELVTVLQEPVTDEGDCII